MKPLSRESRIERRDRQQGLSLVGSGSRRSTQDSRRPQGAFTLLEIMVACAIFFMVAFAILELVTRSLAAAKSLQKRDPDPGIILHALSLTNSFEEGTMTGDYEDIAPGMYPGYRWEAFITEVGSNGLFQVDVLTYNQRRQRQNPTTISGQFWRPNSKPGSASKGRP
jgi:Tfp pilus assembly protein PilV